MVQKSTLGFPSALLLLAISGGDCQIPSGHFLLTNVASNRLSLRLSTQSSKRLTCLGVAMSHYHDEIHSKAIAFDAGTENCEVFSVDLTVQSGSELKQVTMTTKGKSELHKILCITRSDVFAVANLKVEGLDLFGCTMNLFPAPFSQACLAQNQTVSS